MQNIASRPSQGGPKYVACFEEEQAAGAESYAMDRWLDETRLEEPWRETHPGGYHGNEREKKARRAGSDSSKQPSLY